MVLTAQRHTETWDAWNAQGLPLLCRTGLSEAVPRPNRPAGPSAKGAVQRLLAGEWYGRVQEDPSGFNPGCHIHMHSIHPKASGPGWSPWLPAVGLAVLVVALYLKTVNYEFTNYDDSRLVVENPMIRGLGPGHLWRMFTERVMLRYYPVRLVSLALDYRVWRLDPRGYHITNILLHMVNVLLVYGLGLRLLVRADATTAGSSRPADAPSSLPVDARPSQLIAGSWGTFRLCMGAALAAALFAVHPVMVEPVAWVAGRENLLAGFFALACLHVHISAKESRRGPSHRIGLYVLAAMCALAGSLSNALAAVIPALVVAYDLAIVRPLRWQGLVKDTWALWLISAGTVYVKLRTDRMAVAEGLYPASPPLGVVGRVLTASYTYWSNLRSLFWPRNLALIYPNVVADSLWIKGVMAGFFLTAVLIVLIWLVRRRRPVQFGLLWFLVAIIPASQVLPNSVFRADRFLYLPLAGLSLAIGAAAAFHSRRRLAAVVIGLTGVAAIAGLIMAATGQIRVWRDSVTIFERCARVNPTEPAVHINLGAALLRRNEVERANRHFLKALRLRSREEVSAVAQLNLGTAYLRLSQIDEAIQRFNEAIELNPTDPRGYNSRGYALLLKGEPDHRRAIADFNRAIDLRPDYAEAHFNRGNAYADLERLDDAVADYGRVITLRPDHAQALHNRGAAYGKLGRLEAALSDLNRAVTLLPQDASVHFNRGAIHADLGNDPQAVADYTRTIALQPDKATAYLRRGEIYHLRLKQLDLAMQDFTQAITLAPGESEGYFNRGLLWADQGEHNRAITDLTQAIRLKADDAQAYFHRGLAYAERRDFDRARRDWQRAILLAPEGEAARLARRNLQLIPPPATQAT